MNEKRYTAPDMRQALKLVRDELGPDAVILSNQRTEQGVEIVAMAEYNESTIERYQQQVQAAARVAKAAPRVEQPAPATEVDDGVETTFSSLLNQYQQNEAKAAESQPAQAQPINRHRFTPTAAPASPQYQDDSAAAGGADDSLMETMRSEIHHLRNLLKDQMQHMNQDFWSIQHPILAGVGRRLQAQGLSEHLCRQLVQNQVAPATVEDGWGTALANLENQITVSEQEPMANPGVIVFMGPTGAGKTTTAAKLAVRHALKYGRDDLALVTTDQSRIAAYEQLCTIARIIDVPVRRVDAQNSMAEVLASLSHKKRILVDMAGMPEASPEAEHHLHQLEGMGVPVTKLLVLPATTQRVGLQSVLESMQPFGVDACVLTKLDETFGLGEALGLVVENKLPVTYITNGQAIPQDLAVATPKQLMASFVQPNDSSRSKPTHQAANGDQSYDQKGYDHSHAEPGYGHQPAYSVLTNDLFNGNHGQARV